MRSSSWTIFYLDYRTEDNDVELVGVERHRVKFLQFHTDIRPAYFGTWRKVSRYVRARRPLGLDKERFDYDEDSADEWEEEEPGESVDSGDEVMYQLTMSSPCIIQTEVLVCLKLEAICVL